MLCQPQLNYIQTKIVGLQKFRTWELFCEIIRQTQTKINGMMHKLSRSHIHRELHCLGHLQSMKYCLSTIGVPSADPRDPKKNKLGRWTLYSDRNLNSTFSKTKWLFWNLNNLGVKKFIKVEISAVLIIKLQKTCTLSRVYFVKGNGTLNWNWVNQ